MALLRYVKRRSTAACVSALTREGFARVTHVSRETMARLEDYVRLLSAWNRRINLVGRNTIGDVWQRHILDSAQLQPLVPDGAQSLIDLGSGAGFPGLVLAVLGVPRSNWSKRMRARPLFCARPPG